MKDIKKRIDELQSKLRRHRNGGLKETPTRTIFIDPLLEVLGWDVRDPDEVELEYPTIDGKSVDYALKVDHKPVILLEAKALDDPLSDVKAITQVVGYAANNGIDWCVLTNGIRYQVYRSSEKAPAPQKLLFEVLLDPEGDRDQSIDQVVAHIYRISKTSMEDGVLDRLGDEIFTTAKVRRALDELFVGQDEALVRLVRKSMGEDAISPTQVREALARIWRVGPVAKPARRLKLVEKVEQDTGKGTREKIDYGEAIHLEGRPVEVIELYRALDRFCLDLAAGQVVRSHKAKYISWSIGKAAFCSVHLLHGSLKMWLRLSPSAIPASLTFARDVSRVGHWGIGEVEFAIESVERLQQSEPHIQASFEKATEADK